MECGLRTVDCGLWTVDCRPWVEIRRAVPADEEIIRRLLARSRRPCVCSWWWEEALGAETFLLALVEEHPVGALLALLDAGPTAWVRLSALNPEIPVGLWLDATLPRLQAPLEAIGARTLAWTDVGGWLGDPLRARGFRPLTRLINLAKRGRWLPPQEPGLPCSIRPVTAEDIPEVACLDHEAFPPPWWFSAFTLDRLRQETACFLVAEREGVLVGYTEARWAEWGAHIGRLAVAPAFQGQGVGSRLLAAVLSRLWEMGVREVTLNTQEDNIPSQRLYQKFGFQPMGKRIVVWNRSL